MNQALLSEVHFSNFHLANKLVSFKLSNEEPAQSLSASKIDLCSGLNLISQGLKKQGWCYYYGHSQQDKYIHRNIER